MWEAKCGRQSVGGKVWGVKCEEVKCEGVKCEELKCGVKQG